MTKELESAMLEIANKLTDGMDFAIEQAPDVVQQMLLLHRIEAGLAVVFSVAAFVVAVILFGVARQTDDQEVEAPCIIIGVVLSGIGAVVLLLAIPYAAEVFITPKWHIVKDLRP